MADQRSFTPQAGPIERLFEQQQLSRRALFHNLAGLDLVGGSLIPFTTSCGPTPSSPSTASQTPPSHARGTSLSTYRGHHRHVNAVDCSPDGQRIASGSFDQTVQVWQVQ